MKIQIDPLPIDAANAPNGLFEVDIQGLGKSHLICVGNKWFSLNGNELPRELVLSLGKAFRVQELNPEQGMRNATTLIGSVCGAVAMPMMAAAQSTTIWWIGITLNSVAFVLLGGRALTAASAK